MLKNKWYLICPARELKSALLAKQVLGEKIILFRDRSGKAVALEDRCCHRNVQLSLGYLRDGEIVCGYHGWRYEKSGACVNIPSQQAETKIPPTAKIKTYPVCEFNRWIWVFVGAEGAETQTAPANIPEMANWEFTYKSHVFEADLEFTSESLIDPYHIAFAHRHSIGSLLGEIEDFPADFHINEVEDGIEGFYQRVNQGSVAEKKYFGEGQTRKADYRFYFPNLSFIKVHFNKRVLLIVEHVMQVDETHVEMMQITLWENIFSKIPFFARWFMARKSNQIVQEDILFLTSQLELRKKNPGKLRDISVKGDEISLAFRKFWRRKMEES